MSELAKTMGVLLGMWLLLALVGWLGGALPERATVPEHAADTGLPEDAAVVVDAGPGDDARDGLAFETIVEPTIEPVVEPALEPPLAGPPTQVLCDAPEDVVWARGALTADAGEALVVGCADGPQLFAPTADGTLVRVGRVRPVRPTPLRAARFADVDGDTQPDVILAMGEGLFWIPRDPSGGLGTPQRLAPSRHGALATASMDASPGDEIVVIHGEAPRPEVWLFRGGPAPVRSAMVPAPLETTALVLVDLDVDGHLDVVAAGRQQILLAFGDSRGGLPRTRSIAQGARGLAVRAGAEGGTEVVVERDDGACVLTCAPSLAESGGCRPIEGVGGDVREVAILADGRLVGWRHPEVVISSATGGWDPVATLATSVFGVHRLALDARDPERAWLLGSAAREGRRTLELVSVPLGGAFTLRDGPAQAVADGPLPLSIALPDPNSPR